MKRYILALFFFILIGVSTAYCITSPEEYINTISNYMNQKNNHIALNKANEFVQAYPTNTFAYLYRAMIYHRGFNDYYRAIADYDKALQYNHVPEENHTVYIDKGDCYANLGKHTEALEQYNLVPLNYVNVMSRERRLEYYELRATSEFSLELYGAVIKDCTSAINIKAKPILYLLRAMAYFSYNYDFENYERDLHTAKVLCQYEQSAVCNTIERIYAHYKSIRRDF